MDYLENTLELKINEFVKFNNKDEDNEIIDLEEYNEDNIINFVY